MAELVDNYHSQRQSLQDNSHLLPICHHVGGGQSGKDCILIKDISAPKPHWSQQGINKYITTCVLPLLKYTSGGLDLFSLILLKRGAGVKSLLRYNLLLCVCHLGFVLSLRSFPHTHTSVKALWVNGKQAYMCVCVNAVCVCVCDDEGGFHMKCTRGWISVVLMAF